MGGGAINLWDTSNAAERMIRPSSTMHLLRPIVRSYIFSIRQSKKFEMSLKFDRLLHGFQVRFQ